MTDPSGSSLKRKAPDNPSPRGPRAVRRRVTPPPPPPAPAADATVLGLPDVQAPLASPPVYGQPYQLASFSYTPTREIVFDDSALRYYVDPPRRADLTYRYEQWHKREEERGRLDGLLRACALPDVVGERGRANVITWRGVMTKIMAAPYEERDGWELAVMCVNQQLYIEEQFTPDRLAHMSTDDPRQRLMTYFGYSFESYCTSEKPPHKMTAADREDRAYAGGWGGDVNTNIQWCSVVKTKIGNLRIICGGEVDCVRDRYTKQPDTFVELKTSQVRRPGHVGDQAKFEKKLLKYFLQSYLLGVPEIVVGFRTHAGELASVERYETLRLGNEVRDARYKWNHDVCLQWASDMLKWVHKHVRTAAMEDKEKEKIGVSVWRVKFVPRQGVTISRMSEAEVEYVRGGEDRVGFLPTWFYEHLTGTGSSEAEAKTADGNGSRKSGP